MVIRIGQKSARPRRTYFKEWREHRGLTQEQLAERLGTGKSAVSKMETGKSKYNQSSLEAWADALSCSPADLISRPPPTGKESEEEALADLLGNASPEERQKAVAVVTAMLQTG